MQLAQLVGKQLMLIRKDANLTIEELAEKTKLATSTISRYENGGNMNLENIDIILKSCNCDTYIFFSKCIAKMQNK